MTYIEDNLKKDEEFYKKAKEVSINSNEVLLNIKYSNLALYHQNQIIIQLLTNLGNYITLGVRKS